MIRNMPQLSFDELLHAILLEVQEPSYEALLQWSAVYPQHSDALADFFATWAEQEEEEELPAATLDAGAFASRAVSHALNLLHEEHIKERSKRAEKSLSDAAKAIGMSESELAARVQLDEVMLMKLDRGRIPIETLPQLLFERLHEALRLTLEQVYEHLRGPPRLMAAAGRLRSRSKPEAKTESFLEALEKSSLNESQKLEWRRALDPQGNDLHT